MFLFYYYRLIISVFIIAEANTDFLKQIQKVFLHSLIVSCRPPPKYGLCLKLAILYGFHYKYYSQ